MCVCGGGASNVLANKTYTQTHYVALRLPPLEFSAKSNAAMFSMHSCDEREAECERSWLTRGRRRRENKVPASQLREDAGMQGGDARMMLVCTCTCMA